MKTTLVAFFASAVLLTAGFSLPAQACQEGSFSAKGWNAGVNPSGPPSYQGDVTIKKVGELYRLTWKVPNEFVGVGRCDPSSQTLTVSYANLKEGWFGIVWYDKDLKGKWAVSGEQPVVATENLTKK